MTVACGNDEENSENKNEVKSVVFERYEKDIIIYLVFPANAVVGSKCFGENRRNLL